MPLKERRTIVKKDEKDAGSRRWNAPIVSASCESGCFFLNLRSRNRSRRVGGEKAAGAGAARFVLFFCFGVRRWGRCALRSHLDHGRVVLPLLLRGVIGARPSLCLSVFAAGALLASPASTVFGVVQAGV
mgnify:CR=1 FL=1